MSLKAKSNHKLYNTWKHMKDRCYNPNSHAFLSYGGREITVCDRWLDSFENFVFDMGEKPTAQHSLDRIDNNGNYSPKNCKWSTKKEQARNTRQSKYVDYNGKRWLARELAEKHGIDPKIFVSRLLIMDVDRALALPEKKKKGYKVDAFGKSLTVSEWAKETGINQSTLENRLAVHSPEKALSLDIDFRSEGQVNKRGVEQLTKTGDHVAYYDSLMDAGKATEINFRNIQTVCKGARNSAGGYRWRYQ